MDRWRRRGRLEHGASKTTTCPQETETTMQKHTNNRLGMLTIAAAAALSGTASADAAIRYVNANTPLVGGAGTSWADAARHINDVLPLAAAGDEIWVAAGVYYPDRTVLIPFGDGNRDATFAMKSGVKLLGGFVGGESSVSQRNPALNVTILSGDIGLTGTNTDNSRTIMTAINVDANALVDGFTLTKGYCSDGSSATQGPASMGGAMFMTGTSMTISQCTFDTNWARGGAAIGALDSSPTIQKCVFRHGWGDSRGGAIDFWACPNPSISDCEFRSNTAYYGGAINANSETGGTIARCKFISCVSVNGGALSFAGFSDTVVSNSLFLKNECKQISFYQTSFNGGAVQNWCAGTTFINCVFNSNWANGAGAALYDAGPSGSSSTTINCTFYNNSSRDGGVVASASGHAPNLKNGVLWNNVTSAFNGTITVTDSVNGSGGAHFVDADGADNIAGTDDDDLRLSPASSWINAGNNSHIPAGVTTDFLGNARIYDGRVDLGAIEWLVPPPPHCNGDANADQVVNFDDVTAVIANWLGAGPSGDADDNGAVNFEDITTVLVNFGSTCN
jgi:hypothetical protein